MSLRFQQAKRVRGSTISNLCISLCQDSNVKSVLASSFPDIDFTIIRINEFRQNIAKYVFDNYRSYDRAVLYLHDIDLVSKKIFVILLLRLLARTGIYLVDRHGRKKKYSNTVILFNLFPDFLIELLLVVPSLLVHTDLTLTKIKRRSLRFSVRNRKGDSGRINVAYLRTDHWFGLFSGGCVAHTRGVVKGLLDIGHEVTVLTTDDLEYLKDMNIKSYVIKPSGRVRHIGEVPEIEYNFQFIREAVPILKNSDVDVLYQRYSRYNFVGAYLKYHYHYPLIIEYNGSFGWMSKNWENHTLRFERLAEKIEMINLHAADIVVVVSEVLAQDLVERGITRGKILINPNGVDPEVYRPGIDATDLKRTLGLIDRIVVGFIGCFGKWHGAEVLAKAIEEVVRINDDVRFLFIGDGLMLGEVKKIVETAGVAEKVRFTGTIPQEMGPLYLSVCDIFASPHPPNLDGSPFLGSPTKLFEYMAMGRGIVASNLDQIGQVLENDLTAILVEPGNVQSLARGILRLAGNKELRDQLGRNARAAVVERHTWKRHVEKIISAFSN